MDHGNQSMFASQIELACSHGAGRKCVHFVQIHFSFSRQTLLQSIQLRDYSGSCSHVECLGFTGTMGAGSVVHLLVFGSGRNGGSQSGALGYNRRIPAELRSIGGLAKSMAWMDLGCLFQSNGERCLSVV